MSKNYTKTFQNASDKFFTNCVENSSNKHNTSNIDNTSKPNSTYSTHAAVNTSKPDSTYDTHFMNGTSTPNSAYNTHSTDNASNPGSTDSTHATDNASNPGSTDNTAKPVGTDNGLEVSNESNKKTYHRLTLMLDLLLATYLKDESWKNKTSVTQYLISLILKDQNDINKKFIGTLKNQSNEKRQRLDLKINTKLILYLKDEAWKNKTSVTQYLNDLVRKDFENNTL